MIIKLYKRKYQCVKKTTRSNKTKTSQRTRKNKPEIQTNLKKKHTQTKIKEIQHNKITDAIHVPA